MSTYLTKSGLNKLNVVNWHAIKSSLTVLRHVWRWVEFHPHHCLRGDRWGCHQMSLRPAPSGHICGRQRGHQSHYVKKVEIKIANLITIVGALFWNTRWSPILSVGTNDKLRDWRLCHHCVRFSECCWSSAGTMMTTTKCFHFSSFDHWQVHTPSLIECH